MSFLLSFTRSIPASLLLISAAFWTQSSLFAAPAKIVLTGSDLSIAQVVKVAREGALVFIDPAAAKRLKESHAALLRAAAAGQIIYGLSVGVGHNKDKVVLDGAMLSGEMRNISERFNVELLRAHAVGVGDFVQEDVLRATMLVRLNTMLLGHTGVQPEVAAMLAEFLNKKIHPLAESRGSTGEGDIVVLPRIGLAMTGEGDVIYAGKKMTAIEALHKADIKPMKFYAKDALSIISSNAYSAGMAALVLAQIDQLVDNSALIFALSLEGLNGNVSPFSPIVQNLRPFPGQKQTAKTVISHLQGSYLFQADKTRPLQDPLSFRTFSQVTGTLVDFLAFASDQLKIQLNASDDNPAVIYDAKETSSIIVPTASFDPLSWVVAMESLADALVHQARNSVFRSLKLGDPNFTGLPRFLAPNETTQAFEILQNTATSLQAEVQALGQPVSGAVMAVAGDIEDHATNAPLVVKRLDQQVATVRQILAIELLHGAQAVDLRRRAKGELRLGMTSQKLYEIVRQKVPFLEKSRILANDIRILSEMVRQPLLQP